MIEKAGSVQQAFVSRPIFECCSVMQDIIGNQPLARLQSIAQYRSVFIRQNIRQALPRIPCNIIITPLDIFLPGAEAHMNDATTIIGKYRPTDGWPDFAFFAPIGGNGHTLRVLKCGYKTRVPVAQTDICDISIQQCIFTTCCGSLGAMQYDRTHLVR